jgi:hypothetical protein
MRLRANTPCMETGKNRGLRGSRQVILIPVLLLRSISDSARGNCPRSRQNTNRIAKPSRFGLLFTITRKWSSGVSVQ